MKRIFIVIIAVMAVATCNAQTMYVASQKGNVNLRTAPSTTAAKAGTMSASDLLPCLDEVGDYETGWYKVDFNGKDAYVSKTVSTTVDAVIPNEIFGKPIDSTKPWDKIRHQGSIELNKLGKNHAIISMEWMRINLPAESHYYLATVKDGKVIATHAIMGYADSSTPMNEIMENASELDKQIPVGYGEFNDTLFFNGLEFSQYQ